MYLKSELKRDLYLLKRSLILCEDLTEENRINLTDKILEIELKLNNENKYHFGREIIYNLRSCHAISNEVYLHWIDKLIKEEKLNN